MLAEKARHSAAKMEVMTQRMHDIAIETKHETVSMHMITFVALCFLPGTFISVSLGLSPVSKALLKDSQTLMSTDIIRFHPPRSEDSEKVFSGEALKLFLAITLPLMALSFLVWVSTFYLRTGRVKLRFRNEEKTIPALGP